ncbi:MAG TPA: invasion associated locus B family protein [Rhizomicrobium sp.]|nr:invasion associated locus B family protein [Rhizomicrobium sp.]
MRNSLIGIALAAVLVVALFAAAHYGARPSTQQPTAAEQNKDPAAVVGALKPDFVGQVTVGDWRMNCTKPRSLPRQPETGNSAGATPRQGPPPGWKLPHCSVYQTLKNPSNPSDEVRMTLRRMGFQGVLAIFLRYPPEIVENGDMSTLRVDSKDIPMPIRTCAARFCLSIMSVKKVDEPDFLKAKSMTLSFTSRVSNKEIVVPFKMHGFAEAVGAMRRMDK